MMTAQQLCLSVVRFSQQERKTRMSATALPLPLQLNQPVALASDLETLLAENLDVENVKYDPLTQVRAPEMWRHHGGHNTSSRCTNYGLIQVDDILQDFTV